MKKIILLAGLVAGGVAFSATAFANNWLLYLPAILAGSGGGTTTPPVTTESNKWLLFLPAILAGSQGGQPPVVTGTSLNDTGIIATVGSTGEDDASYGRDSDPATNINDDGHAGFSFTKLAANGTELAADALSWACVKDNVTGLVWEAKATVEGTTDQKTWAEATGEAALFSGCGAYSTCRLPTVKELFGLVSYNASSKPIDSTFFPNNVTWAYWTGTPVANDQGVAPVRAWVVNFVVPYLDSVNTVDNPFYVRAVCE
ncbi:MAG: DUF1566 domain-containing protein [Candidatus Electrothrix sp. Rat3]|nr:DUF1566 domain-containing protein [Candidatus Electrothrix rattekaaiensis]